MSADPRTIESPLPPIREGRRMGNMNGPPTEPKPDTPPPAQCKSSSGGNVELKKIRRELLTLASRVEKLAKSQETA